VESIEIDGPFAAGRVESLAARAQDAWNGGSLKFRRGVQCLSFPCPVQRADSLGGLKVPAGALGSRSAAHSKAIRLALTRRQSVPVWWPAFPQACESCARRWRVRLRPDCPKNFGH
jgi:hypothetical protein